MLSELIFASAKRAPGGTHAPGISMSGFFPCAYRMYRLSLGEVYDEEELTPQNVLNMEDGWTQESQAVERLERAGVRVKNRQMRVTVGKSEVPGRPDGIVTLSGQDYLWEFKAMNSSRFGDFTRWGLGSFVNYKAQVQGYLLGTQLDKCLFLVKDKDSNNYQDTVESLDRDFILPIVEWCDRIRLEGWVPEPVRCKWCSQCGLDCFGKSLDLSWMDTKDELEMAQQWIKGKKYKDGGEAMMEEARSYFVGIKDKYGNWIKQGLIGDKDELRVSGLEVRKITQHRFDISRQKIVEEFGAEALLKVGEENEITQYRIREV